MRRVHSPMTIHRPSLVSRKARARGACRLRHLDHQTRYLPPASHGALIAALPAASSLLTVKPTDDAEGDVAGVGEEAAGLFEGNDVLPIGLGLAGLGAVLTVLYFINSIAKHQALRAMMSGSNDRFPQIDANITLALASYRIKNSVSEGLAPEVSDPKSWPLPGLSQGFVRLAGELSDIIDADLDAEGLLGRVGPTVLLSRYGISEFVAGRSGRMKYAAQLLYGESEGFTQEQSKKLSEILYGTPFKSLSEGAVLSLTIFKKAAAEHETIAREKSSRRGSGREERMLAQGAHLMAAAIIWRRRALAQGSLRDRTNDLARARMSLDDAQALFGEVRDSKPEWFNHGYSNLEGLSERLGSLKKAIHFQMYTSDAPPPPPTPIGPLGRGPIGPGGHRTPPSAAFIGLGACAGFNAWRPAFKPV